MLKLTITCVACGLLAAPTRSAASTVSIEANGESPTAEAGSSLNVIDKGGELNDVENISGGAGNDRLVGNRRRNRIDGDLGYDRLVGGGGRDRFEDGERVRARDGRRDLVHCGRSSNRELVIADRIDRVFGCARVLRP